mgnify:CR=1 FL=1|jgi:hypothetical protein
MVYETFKPDETRRLLNRLEFHCTPKYGNWLNMTEIKLSALSRQCLANRIDQMSVMQTRVTNWEEARTGRSPQQTPGNSQLAVHYRRRSDQTRFTLPDN